MDRKAVIRDQIIEAGRRLFKDADASAVSLRRIATEAGFAPSTIYTYFADHHALLTAIRSVDLANAIAAFEAVRSQARDSVDCVRMVFGAVVDHWVDHFDQFEVVYAQRSLPVPRSDDTLFANSDVVRRLYRFYHDIIAAFLAEHGRSSIATELATDSIIAATHGMILFTRRTINKPWPVVRDMSDRIVDALLHEWGGIAPRAAPPIRNS